MKLPGLIEIEPVPGPVRAQVGVPGSKSITNRALILAALADGETVLHGALWSEDTKVMVECLQELGFMVNVEPDPNEGCNRRLTVYGKGGEVPPGGTDSQPMELFVGNAGTAARFLSAFLCLGRGVYRLTGVARMHERPQASLFQALRALGYRVESANDRLPALVFGGGRQPGRCRVSVNESSQFASALLLASARGGWTVEVEGDNVEEAAYVSLTRELLKAFPRMGGEFQIEPDASSASYFWAADALLQISGPFTHSAAASLTDRQDESQTFIRVFPAPGSDWQIDSRFRKFLPFPSRISRQSDLGDSIMTAIALAPLGQAPVAFHDLARLRVQECERVAALRTELTRCGAQVVEQGETLTVFPSKLHGAEIETYDDHRMAMCFAILGLKVRGIRINNPSCVKKTFPDFFQKLASPPPRGLGAVIRDGKTGGRLEPFALLAD